MFSHADKFLCDVLDFSFQDTHNNQPSEDFKKFSGKLQDSSAFQNFLELGCISVACPHRVKIVVELDDFLGKLSVQSRIDFVKNLIRDTEVFLIDNNVPINEFTVQSFRRYWESELFIMTASLNPLKTSPYDFLYHRSKMWSDAMFFMLQTHLHAVANDRDLMESTVLRGLALALADDSDDRLEDIQSNEHTLFTVYKDLSLKISNNALYFMENFQEKCHPIFSVAEKLLGQQSILHYLCAAALISLNEMDSETKSQNIFHVRKFLKSFSL